MRGKGAEERRGRGAEEQRESILPSAALSHFVFLIPRVPVPSSPWQIQSDYDKDLIKELDACVYIVPFDSLILTL